MWKIYVGNLDARIRERDLADEFSVYGLVRSVWVARRPPGYAFIEFDTRREADDAVSALDGKHGWRVELSRRSSGGHRSKPYSSENRCSECGSSRHYTKDCRSPDARGSYRRSSSPRTRTIVNRYDFPRKRERSISPETVCIKISQNDDGNSPTNERDAPKQEEHNTFSERYHSRSPNDQEGSADECIVPRKRERKRSPDPSKSPQNIQDSSHANENDAPRELEGDASPEHYPSSSQNGEDGSADEKQDNNRSSEPEHNMTPQNNQDRLCADELSPEREEHSDSRSPLLESSPEY